MSWLPSMVGEMKYSAATWIIPLPLLLCQLVRAQTVSGPVPVALQDDIVLQDGVVYYQLVDQRGKLQKLRVDPSRIDLLQNDIISGYVESSCFEHPGPQTFPGSAADSNFTFTNVSDKIGIKHQHRQNKPVRPYCVLPYVIPVANSNKTIKLEGEFCTPEQISGGVAAADYDQDGYVDLYFTVADGRSHLYHNNGNGTFRDVTLDVGIGPAKYGSGAVWADVDADGDLDLYVTTLGDTRHYLYINQGGVFTEEAVGRNMSLERHDKRKLSGMTPNAGDYDRDGFVDIYVTEWMLNNIGQPIASQLMHNLGAKNPGVFEDVTDAAGVSMKGYSRTVFGVEGIFTFCSSFTDLDNDGWGDLLLTSDYGLSKLFWSNQNGTFTECTKSCGLTKAPDAMGHSMGDWDMDGRMDYWMTAIHHNATTKCEVIGCSFSEAGNLFYRNNGGRQLADYTDKVGVRKGGWGWGNTLIDFNNDRWLDFFMTNGFNEGGTTVDDQFSADASKLWENLGPSHNLSTVEVTAKYNVGHKAEGRGVIKVDYDNDGDEDIIIVNHIKPPTIYRNDGGNRNNWIRIRALHSCPKLVTACDSITARVQVRSADGWTQLQEVGSGSQFMGQNELTTHFGLGNISSPVNVTVTWPWLNSTVTYTDVPPNVKLRVFAPGKGSTIASSFTALSQCPHLAIASVTQPTVGVVKVLPNGRAVSWDPGLDLATLSIPGRKTTFDYTLQMTPVNSAKFNVSATVTISMSTNSTSFNTQLCHGSQYLPSVYPTITNARLLTGYSNNQKHLLWGGVGTNLRRQVKQAYADNLAAPSGQCSVVQRVARKCTYPQQLSGKGSMRPSPRNISNVIFHQISNIYSSRGLSDLHNHWGQFLAHDTDFSSPLPRFEFQRERNDVWLPISVPRGDVHFDPYDRGDKYLPFLRTTFTGCSGRGVNRPREQFNKITSIIDGSMVYGTDKPRNTALRTMKDGKLKLQTVKGETFIPFNTFGQDNDNPVGRPIDRLLFAGDTRANVQPGLIVLHTLFVREHNRLCDSYKALHPTASDSEIFEYARRIVIGEMQAITFREFLPATVGHKLPAYKGYNISQSPDVSNIFATAAFRFGHSQVNTHLWRFDSAGRVIPEGHLPLREAYFAPERVLHEGGIDPYLRGFVEQRSQAVDTKMVDDMRNVLFPVARRDGLDLASMNIQRGRDHGLPDYNSARVQLGFKPVQKFSDISTDATVVAQLEKVYQSINVIDPWVGGLAEDKANRSELGPFFEKLLVDNFLAIRDGDRFWYERFLNQSEIDLVHNLTLSEIIRLNTGVKNISKDLFFSSRFCEKVIDFQCIPRPSNTCTTPTSTTTEPATTFTTTPTPIPTTAPATTPAMTMVATTTPAITTVASTTTQPKTALPTESACCRESQNCNALLVRTQAEVSRLQGEQKTLQSGLNTTKTQLATEKMVSAACKQQLGLTVTRELMLLSENKQLNQSLANLNVTMAANQNKLTILQVNYSQLQSQLAQTAKSLTAALDQNSQMSANLTRCNERTANLSAIISASPSPTRMQPTSQFQMTSIATSPPPTTPGQTSPASTMSASSTSTVPKTTIVATMTTANSLQLQQNLTLCYNMTRQLRSDLSGKTTLLTLTLRHLNNCTSSSKTLQAHVQNLQGQVTSGNSQLSSCHLNVSRLQLQVVMERQNATAEANITASRFKQQLDHCTAQHTQCSVALKETNANFTSCQQNLQSLACHQDQLTALQIKLNQCQAQLQVIKSSTTTQAFPPTLSPKPTHVATTAGATTTAKTSSPQAQNPMTSHPTTLNPSHISSTPPATTIATQETTHTVPASLPTTQAATSGRTNTGALQQTTAAGAFITRENAEVQQLRARVAQLTRENINMKANVSQLNANITELLSKKSQLAQQQETTEKRLMEETQKRATLERELAEMKAKNGTSLSSNASSNSGTNYVLISALGLAVLVILAMSVVLLVKRRRSKLTLSTSEPSSGSVMFSKRKYTVAGRPPLEPDDSITSMVW